MLLKPHMHASSRLANVYFPTLARNLVHHFILFSWLSRSLGRTKCDLSQAGWVGFANSSYANYKRPVHKRPYWSNDLQVAQLRPKSNQDYQSFTRWPKYIKLFPSADQSSLVAMVPQNAILVLWIRFYNQSRKNKSHIKDSTQFINFIENTLLSDEAILRAVYTERGPSWYKEDPSRRNSFLLGLHFGPCGAQVGRGQEGIKNGGRQNQKCNFAPSALFTGVNKYLSA